MRAPEIARGSCWHRILVCKKEKKEKKTQKKKKGKREEKKRGGEKKEEKRTFVSESRKKIELKLKQTNELDNVCEWCG